MSMSLSQNLECSMTITHEMSACGSIFPEIEEFLQESSDHQNALEYISRNKKTDNYVCMMDFLVCEFFGAQFIYACLQFYSNNGPALKEQISEEDRVKISMILLFALKHAYKLFQEERRISWKGFVEEVVLKLAA